MSYLVYCVYRALAWLVALLPLDWSFMLGQALGLIAYWLAAPYRALVMRNLRIALDGEQTQEDLRTLARQHFTTLGANLFSSFKLATMPREDIADRVEFLNFDLLHAAAEPGQGVVLILSHLGNWELMAQVVEKGPPGRKVGTVYQPLGNPHFDRHVRETRARFGLVPFDRRRGFNEVIKFLREGNVAGVLVDQHAGDGGIWTPLFGRLASTSPLAATLAIRTGATLIPVAVYTTGRARWRIVISPGISPAATSPEDLTATINLKLEQQIRVSPADWFWLHDRWKTPEPDFLLVNYKRGVTLPRGFPESRLKPFRILIRSSNWLGDAVMSVPAVCAIKAGRIDARVTILAPAKLADFWKTVAAVDEVISIDRGERPRSVARKLRPHHFDAAFVFPNSPRTGLEVWLAGIPRRIGYRRPWRRFTINDTIPDPPPGPMVHQVHHYLALAKYAGADVTPSLLETPRPKIDPAAPLVLGLVPGAEYGPAKRWLPERFAETAQRISETTGASWRIFGVEADRPAADVIATQLGARCENLIGKTTLAELTERMRECRAILTNDTGSMHLAAHLGVPLVAIFGSTEDRLTGPLGPGSRVIRHHAVCSPCFLRECPLDFRCMTSVTVEETVDAIMDSLNSSPTR